MDISDQLSPEDFIKAVEHAYDHVVITDREGLIIYANKGVELITGFKVAEVIGTKAGKLWGGVMGREFYQDMWHRLTVEKQSYLGEMINRRKDGKTYTADVRISPILDKNGDVVRFVGIERDISYYKEAEKLAHREKAVFEAIGEGLVVTDIQGFIVNADRAFEQLTGWTIDEVLGKPMLEILQKVDERGQIVPKEQRSLTKVLSGKEVRAEASSLSETHYYIKKDGTKLAITGVVTPIYLNGKLFGAVQVFRDISNEKAIATMKADILSLVAHQLKTPIGQLHAYLDNMLSGVVGEFSAEQKQYIVNMDQTLERLIRMTSNILNASRIERGVIQMEIGPLNLGALINNVTAVYEPLAKQKGLELRTELSFSGQVLADKVTINEILSNLVDNAVKFTQKGYVKIAAEIAGNLAVIKVIDTGPGIELQLLKVIFDRDKQIPEMPQPGQVGSRLGMYIAKTLIKKQNGDLWVESEQGKGTTFTLTLPLAAK